MDKSAGLSHEMRWLLLAVLVQAGIGASMVPMRYLQVTAGLPGFALVAFSDLIAFMIMAWRIFPKIPKKFWRSRLLWLMVFVVVLRTLCLTFALRFTRAYLVQLITLMAPFLVVFLNRIFLKEHLPRFTLLAISFSVIGGMLMVFGNIQSGAFIVGLTGQDLLGVGLAFLGTFGIAFYMIIVRRSRRVGLPARLVYIAQVGTLTAAMTILSLLSGEDWRSFLNMDVQAWMAFLFIALGMEIAGKNGNIAVLRALGAPLVSSMLAVRLVAALFVGWIILDEQLTSPLQWGGAVLVSVTITWYLARQSQHPDQDV